MKNILRNSVLSCVLLSSPLCFANVGFEPGNTLASSQNTIFEFNANGDLIHQIQVPRISTYEVSRDFVVLEDGRLAVYNGTFTPELAVYDGTTWESFTVEGWSTVNNGSYGGITNIGNTVYVTDTYTAYAGSPMGLISIDLDTGLSDRFISDADYIDITLGGDGFFYALRNFYGDVDVIDPETLLISHSIDLGHTSSSRAVTANDAGEIFMVSWDGYIAKYDADGVIQHTLTVGNDLHDIDWNESGRIVFGGRFGTVYTTDESLNSFSTIQIGTTNTFVSLVPLEAPPPPVLVGSSYRKGRWINTTLNWSAEVTDVDVYYNGTLLETVTGTTSATYRFKKKISQVFQVCNAGTYDCSGEYVAN